MRIISWNINGLRAVHKKGFLEWVAKESPDILCVQETKIHDDQIPLELRNIQGYTSLFSFAEKKGYSGTGFWSKIKPDKTYTSLDKPRFDSEGRMTRLDIKDTSLLNVYFPNGKASPERLRYKMDFYAEFLSYAKGLLKNKKNVIVCGDVNTAHTEIDLARPKENADISGFLPEERAWIDKFLEAGFIDTLRVFEKDGGHYTWWDLKSGARARNVGWRIDYFFISANLTNSLKSAFILQNVPGSDHCPIGIELNI